MVAHSSIYYMGRLYSNHYQLIKAQVPCKQNAMATSQLPKGSKSLLSLTCADVCSVKTSTVNVTSKRRALKGPIIRPPDLWIIYYTTAFKKSLLTLIFPSLTTEMTRKREYSCPPQVSVGSSVMDAAYSSRCQAGALQKRTIDICSN